MPRCFFSRAVGLQIALAQHPAARKGPDATQPKPDGKLG